MKLLLKSFDDLIKRETADNKTVLLEDNGTLGMVINAVEKHGSMNGFIRSLFKNEKEFCSAMLECAKEYNMPFVLKALYDVGKGTDKSVNVKRKIIRNYQSRRRCK